MTRFHLVLAVLAALAGFCLVVIAALLPSAAHAQAPMCKPFKEITDYLATKFAEVPASMGIMDQGKTMMIQFANPETGTWTLIALGTGGIGCVMASGDGYTEAPKQKEGNPA